MNVMENHVNIKSKTQQYLERIFFGLLIMFVLTQVAQAGKIIKWTDEHGVVHYGDVLPTSAVGKRNSELSKQGVVVKKQEKHQVANSASDENNLQQLRKDSALLASYSSVEEIDLAMNRNLGTQKQLLTALMARLADNEKLLSKKKRMLEHAKQSNNKASIDYLKKDILATQRKFDQTASEVTATQNNIALTEARFASYKHRYAELRPRNQSLSSINMHKRNLSELIAWKRTANQRLSEYLKKTVQHKRAGQEVPQVVVLGIQQANQEIARADQEIAAIQANIRNTEHTFTSK